MLGILKVTAGGKASTQQVAQEPRAALGVPEARQEVAQAANTTSAAPVNFQSYGRRPVGGLQQDWTQAEKQLLEALDSRRVELERRNEALNLREEKLKEQSNQLAGKLAELRSLTAKLSEKRKEKEHRYETRLEQLAAVYSSMPPKEAAPLIGRLENDIALGLLQRMPGKRMGQILSMMTPERAIELTKQLTSADSL